MNFLRPHFLSVLSASAIMMAAWNPASGQNPDRFAIQHVRASQKPVFADNSTTIFQSLFHYLKVRPIRSVDAASFESRKDGDRSVIVVVFQTRNVRVNEDFAKEQVRRALEKGGSVLIATNRGGDLSDYFPLPLEKDAVRMNASRLVDRNEAALDDKRVESLAFAAPLQTGDAEDDLFHKLERVVLVAPAQIELTLAAQRYLPAVATLPVGTKTAEGQKIGNTLAVARAGTQRNPARIAVIADPGIFTNRALFTSAQPEANNQTDNFRFAYQTALWLHASQRRSECVYIVDGQVQDDFNHVDWATATQPITPPIPPIRPSLKDGLLNRPFQKAVAEMTDTGIANLEDKHLLDEVIAGRGDLSDFGYQGLLGALGVVGVVFLAVVVLRHAWQARHRAEFIPLPDDPLRLGRDAAIGSFEHRRLEMVRSGELLGPVREYLRAMFVERGLETDDEPSTMPAMEYRVREVSGIVPSPTGEVWTRSYRGRLTKSLQTLWKVAFDRSLRTLTYTRWKELEPLILSVRRAAEAGQWRVAARESRR